MPDLIDLDTALARIAGLAAQRQITRLPTSHATGRVLAQAIALRHDQPPFDRATMDGYACRCPAGAGARFTVIGTIRAGDESDLEPGPGEAVRIMTGARVPAGCTVVPTEDSDGGEQVVLVSGIRHLEGRRNVAFQGEDGRSGDTILSAGTRLGPVAVALAAMAGHQELPVLRPPRIRILVSGDELVHNNAAGIADSNGPFLLGLLAALGIEAEKTHLDDRAEATRAALLDADAELLITSGGVSMGDRDHIPDAAAACGYDIVFHGVAIQPGKPVLLARHASGRLLVGLPGNPVSVVVCAHLILTAVLERAFGLPAQAWQERSLASAWPQAPKRLLFLPGRLTDGGVEPIRWNGSGDLLAAAHGDGLVRLQAGHRHEAGESVAFLPYLGHQTGQGGLLPRRA